MKGWVKVTLWVVGIIIVLGIMGSMFSGPETNYQQGVNNPSTENSAQANSGGSAPSDGKIKILSHEMKTGDYGTISVVGTAENVAGKNLGYVEIRVKFYDDSDALLETFIDNVNDLGAGEKWNFEVVYPSLDGDEVARYEIGVGSVF